MNTDEARMLGGVCWRWTTRNDRDNHSGTTAWPCASFADDGVAVIDDGHATQEEAARHFYDECLLGVVAGRFMDWTSCEVPACDTPTKWGMGNRGLGRMFPMTMLCDDCRNRETLAELRPFSGGGIQLIHS